MADTTGAAGPDFGAGFPLRDIADGAMVQGTAGGEDVMLAARR